MAFPGSNRGLLSFFSLLSLPVFSLPVFSLPVFAGTPVPKVTGPLPITATSYPFGAAGHERVPEGLKSIGYVEEEYLISGTANAFMTWPAPGPASSSEPPNAPGRRVTFCKMRRPASKARFSGTVAVEMANPSNLFDLNLGWTINHREFARNGDAWVMITAKPVSVVTLKSFNPERYVAVSWANPVPVDDPKNCPTVPADSTRTTENGLVWDIYTQTGAWLRSAGASNPLAYGETDARRLPVQRLYAWGYSQTGSFLYTYINAIHPLDVKANRKPMFDAYLIAVASGPSAINQCASPIPAGDPRRTIKDAGVPVVRVMSQSDYLSGIAARRPDSDAAPDLYRNYEIAGSAHATPDELKFAAAPDDISEERPPEVPPMSCNEAPAAAAFPNWVAFDAIFHNLDLWVRKGTCQRRVPNSISGGKPHAGARQNFGNVTGRHTVAICRRAGEHMGGQLDRGFVLQDRRT